MNTENNNLVDDLLVGINLVNYETLDSVLVKSEHLMALRQEILGLRSYIKDQNKHIARLKVEINALISQQINRPKYESLDALIKKGQLYDSQGA